MFRLKSDTEMTLEAAEDEDEAIEEQIEEQDNNDVEINGWIYAFSFPAIKRNNEPFPIKIGFTASADVETSDFKVA